MMSVLRRERNQVFETLITNIDVLITTLEGNEEASNAASQDFDESAFWNNLETAINVLSHECTKLAVAFSNQPLPDTKVSQDLANGIEKACVSLSSTYFSLPNYFGRLLHQCFRKSLKHVFKAVQELCSEVKNGRGELVTTGKVWELCNKIKELPRDNKTAVVRALQLDLGIVEDALDEFQQAVDNADDDTEEETLTFFPIRNGFRLPEQRPKWSESDRELLPPALGLIKTARACLKKTAIILSNEGLCDNYEHTSQMDDIHKQGCEISPLVDDFILTAYPPLIPQAIEEEATKLARLLRGFLVYVQQSHICSKDKSWTDFLLRAVDHNFDRLKNALPST